MNTFDNYIQTNNAFGKFYWLLPNGKLIEVRPFGHTPYVEAHPEQFGFTRDSLWRQPSAFFAALKNNAIRIGILVREEPIIAEAEVWNLEAIREQAYNLFKALNDLNVDEVRLFFTDRRKPMRSKVIEPRELVKL